MDLKEVKSIITQIAQNLSDQGKVTDLLTQLSEGVETAYTTADTIKVDHEKAQEQIKSLQQTNMNLFLKVGNPTPDEALQSTEKLSYEDLLKEVKI